MGVLCGAEVYRGFIEELDVLNIHDFEEHYIDSGRFLRSKILRCLPR